MTTIDTVHPTGAWTFDEEVTEAFDDMLARSIPQYEVMRQACFDIACHYRQPDTDIVDLGCSRGEAMAALVDYFGRTNRFVGVEASQPMRAACESRFAKLIERQTISIENIDLRRAYPTCRPSVVLCVLTLQFTPIEYRQQILRRIYDSLLPGGALILVEKVLGADASMDEMMVSHYYSLKSDNGYSQEAITRKRLSLEGVLVPVTAKWNEELLRTTGFGSVDCFWRWMNFAGWVAVK